MLKGTLRLRSDRGRTFAQGISSLIVNKKTRREAHLAETQRDDRQRRPVGSTSRLECTGSWLAAGVAESKSSPGIQVCRRT